MLTRSRSLAAAALALVAALAAPTPPTRAQDPGAGRDEAPVVVPPAREGARYVRALVFGDWGSRGPGQRLVAKAMAERARREPVDLLITTGDNFYPRGVQSTDDPQWAETFEEVYADPALQVPVYPALGNHDWMGKVQAQVDYSALNPRWRLPARYHAFTWPERGASGAPSDAPSDAPIVEVFITDTQALLLRGADAEQRAWLAAALARSTARWKVVVGHHPIYSHGRHGGSAALRERLEPLLVEHGVDLYMAGHDHTLELLRPVSGVLHLVSGGGGGPEMAYRIEESADAYHAASGGGFVALRAGDDDLVLEFVGPDGRTRFVHTLIKGRSGPF